MAKNPFKVPAEPSPIEFFDLGKYGLIADTRAHLINPQAFTDVRNMRFVPNGFERFKGDMPIFGTPPIAPHILVNVPSIGVNFWLYADETKIYGYDGVDHEDLTRSSGGDYTAGSGTDWQYTILGGTPIFNNFADIPQYWTALNLSNNFANLPGWPSDLRAKCIKAAGPYLVAFNLIDGATSLPKAIRWSSYADPGTVPASWDYTDPTIDAGQRQITDDKGGEILDALLLGNQMVIYTNFATHVARYVGGIEIFVTDLLFKESGILSPKCVSSYSKGVGHLVVSQDDILVHQGTKQAESVVEAKNKRLIFDQIEPSAINKCFTFENPATKEIYFCFPTVGSENPNLAWVWDYKFNTQTLRDINFNAADVGAVYAGNDTETWDSVSGSWEEDSEPWNAESRQKVVVSSVSDEMFYALESGDDFAVTNTLTYVERIGLAIDGKNEDGKPKGSIQSRKQLKRCWLKIPGEEPVRVQFASQEEPGGTIRWTDPQTYTPGIDRWVDVVIEGKLLGYRIEGVNDRFWSCEGIDLEINVLSRL